MDLLTGLFRSSGTTFMLVSHDPDMSQYTDRTIHLLDGKNYQRRNKPKREEIESMRVQKMCRRLVLLLLAAACLCQMALAVDPAFRYGSKNVSWVEMDGDDFLLLDGDETDRDHPTAYAGDWMKVNLPMRTSIGEGVLQELRVEACEPESLSEARRWPIYHVRLFCQLQDVRFFL